VKPRDDLNGGKEKIPRSIPQSKWPAWDARERGASVGEGEREKGYFFFSRLGGVVLV
jgi:hypothetical protein